LILNHSEQDTNHLIDLLGQALPAEAPRLVRLPQDRPIVYVGDIHGDMDAVNIVVSRFPSPDHIIVFLGDIVDRLILSAHSRESPKRS